MKSFLFALMLLTLASCTEVLEVVSTGEKVTMDVSPYIIGDTVILYKSLRSTTWNLDVNWVMLNDTTITTMMPDSSVYTTFYRRAVVIR